MVIIALGHFFKLARYSLSHSLHLAIYLLGHFINKFCYYCTWPLFPVGLLFTWPLTAFGNLFTWPLFHLADICCRTIALGRHFSLGPKHQSLAISLGPNSFGPNYSFGQIMAKRIFRSKRKVWPSNPHGRKERYLSKY